MVQYLLYFKCETIRTQMFAYYHTQPTTVTYMWPVTYLHQAVVIPDTHIQVQTVTYTITYSPIHISSYKVSYVSLIHTGTWTDSGNKHSATLSSTHVLGHVADLPRWIF